MSKYLENVLLHITHYKIGKFKDIILKTHKSFITKEYMIHMYMYIV